MERQKHMSNLPKGHLGYQMKYAAINVYLHGKYLKKDLNSSSLTPLKNP